MKEQIKHLKVYLYFCVIAGFDNLFFTVGLNYGKRFNLFCCYATVMQMQSVVI